MRRILIVDDHPLVGESIALALSGDAIDARFVDPTVDDPLDIIEADRPDTVFLDLDWGPGVSGGVAYIEPVVATGARCVILTGTIHHPLFGYCLELGAAGVITKSQPFDDLLHHLRADLDGLPVNPDRERLEWMLAAQQTRRRYRDRTQPFAELTPAEQQVLAELIDGHTVADIAEARVVAVSTIRSHVRHVLEKLGTGTQLGAVALARDAGWEPDDGVLDEHGAELVVLGVRPGR